MELKSCALPKAVRLLLFTSRSRSFFCQTNGSAFKSCHFRVLARAKRNQFWIAIGFILFVHSVINNYQAFFNKLESKAIHKNLRGARWIVSRSEKSSLTNIPNPSRNSSGVIGSGINVTCLESKNAQASGKADSLNNSRSRRAM